MPAFCSSFGIPSSDTLGSRLYASYSHLKLIDRNKLVQAHILRYSLNTLKLHNSNVKKYTDTCDGFVLPIDIGHLNSFLLKKAEDGKSFVTIESYLQSVKFISGFLCYDFPEDKILKNLLFFLQKFCVKNEKIKRSGFQKTHLLKLHSEIMKSGGFQKLSMLELRSFMLLLFCYCTLARFDCAKNVHLDNVHFFSNYVKCIIPKSKTDQVGDGQYVFLVNLPELNTIQLLAEYIRLFNLENVDNVSLFPPLKWDKSSKSWGPDGHKKLSYSAAHSGLKSLLKKFGMHNLQLSLHSPRIGATTDAFQAGTPAYIIDKRGRWKDKNTKYNYAKDSDEQLVKVISTYV